MPGSTQNERQTRHRLFVGGLDPETTNEKLKKYFEEFGELADFYVTCRPDTGRSKGFGFVEFSNREMLEDCLNQQPHTLDGRTVGLKRAFPRDNDMRGVGSGGRGAGHMLAGSSGSGVGVGQQQRSRPDIRDE